MSHSARIPTPGPQPMAPAQRATSTPAKCCAPDLCAVRTMAGLWSLDVSPVVFRSQISVLGALNMLKSKHT